MHGGLVAKLCLIMHGGLVAKLCLTLCGPKDGSPLGFSVLGVSQARLLK